MLVQVLPTVQEYATSHPVRAVRDVRGESQACRAERRVLEFWSFVAGVSVRLEWWTSWAPHVLNSLTRNAKHPETPEDRRFLFPRGQVAQVVLDQIGEEAAGMIGEEAAGI